MGTAYNDATEDWVGVLGTGAFSRLEFFREKKQKYLLWNDLIYGNNLNTEQRFDDFLLFRTDLEIRKLVGFRAGQVQNDLGLLIRSEIYFSEVVFARANMEPLVTRKRWEVGLTVGPTERFKFLKNLIPVPRIGLSYRFGDGARTIRLVIRSRF